METLQLPQDLYWGTKTEPPSPPSDELLFPSISLFSPKLESDDDEEAEDVTLDAETEELIATVLLEGQEILYQLEISDDKIGQWDCIQGANYPSHLLPLPITNIKDSTSELKRYSENADILQLSPQAFAPENFNFAINSYSYAPQQPPSLQEQQQQLHQLQQESEQQKIDYENFFCDLNSVTYPKLPAKKEEFLGSPTPSSSSAYEESSESERGDEIVDEILRIHTKNLPDLTDDNDSQYSSISYSTESNDSYKNNSTDSMSPISNHHDWPLLTTSDEYSSQENLQKINDLNGGASGGQIKKRSRLYVRNIDEKKSRKKEQNKNAATRYRQKKKMEMKLDLDEERVLLDKNTSLRKTVEDYQREAKYLKKLIREFYKKN